MGILEREAECDSDLAVVREGNYTTYFHKGDWFISLSEAKEKAELMRQRKIKAVKKQIEKLEKLIF